MKLSSTTLGEKKKKIKVTIPIENRIWQKEMLKGVTKKRLSVVVAHRRAGKTEAVCVRLILAALSLKKTYPKSLFAYVAPFLNQAKQVAWERLKFYALKIPKTKINETELLITLFNGAQIKLFGADYPDRLRGLGFDGVVMDEVAQMRPETWKAVVRPALADRHGWAIFIGTPKGINIFYEMYQLALKNPEKWYSSIFSADKTEILPSEELNNLKREMGSALFRQEFLCDFQAANVDSFIDFELVNKALKGKPLAINFAPLVFGLDPARFGDDRTVLVTRRGLAVESIDIWHKLDLMATAARVSEKINKQNPKAVFIDSVGLGAGVVDRLRQLGHKILAVNSGTRATKAELYFNLKAEMWGKMKNWLEEGAQLPDYNPLKTDLLAPNYDFDSQGRLKIESKDDLKKRGLISPDCADALALTFAVDVANNCQIRARPKFAEM